MLILKMKIFFEKMSEKKKVFFLFKIRVKLIFSDSTIWELIWGLIYYYFFFLIIKKYILSEKTYIFSVAQK